MRPVRKSSEGPEVVPQNGPVPNFTDKYAIAEKLAGATAGRWTQCQKQVDPYQVETRNFPPPLPPPVPLPLSPVPSLPRALSRRERIEKPGTRRKSFGLVTTIILVVGAFLLGGGIGGGIGGAIVAKEKSKSKIVASATIVAPTTTVTPSPISTTVLDAASCPLIHNTLYNSTVPGKTFLQVCQNNFLPPDGQTIDIKNETVSGFEPCLDLCAKTDGCVAASWVMFSASNPSSNSVCFLKNSIGIQTKADSVGQVASGYLQPLP